MTSSNRRRPAADHIEAIELVVHGPALKTFVTASIDSDIKGTLDRLQVEQGYVGIRP